ncbi:MAG: hypothetical protein R2863_03815 [Candidatus Kapaibacterium sp.]
MEKIEVPEIDFGKLKEVTNEFAKEMSNLEDPKQRSEEINFNQEEQVWEVVVSYLIREEPGDSVLSFLAFSSGEENSIVRKYKMLTINQDWRLLGYKIYDRN